MYTIKFSLITESICLIGNQTTPFSTGGVDQSTLVDIYGYPVISASSFKGALRNIYRENRNYFTKTNEYVQNIFNEILKRYTALICNLKKDDKGGDVNKERIEQLNNIVKKIEEKKNIPEYIFGIEELNNTPKLWFSDIKVKNKKDDIDDYFLIDMKNTIEEKDNKLESKPRTYKCIRPGIEFEGIIRFNENGFNNNELRSQISDILCDVEKALLFFNNGFYGIGNSKSRGYGNIKIDDITIDSTNTKV